MEIVGEVVAKAPRSVVASFFRDPKQVVECVPGIQSYEITGTAYKAKVKFKVGAISGTFNIEGDIKESKPEEEYTVTLRGRSMGNSFDALATVTLSDVEGGTKISYKAEAKLGGLLAALGKGLIEGVAKDIVTQLFQCAEKKVSQ